MTENYAKLVDESYSTRPKYTEIEAGVPEDYTDIQTLGDLLDINYKIMSVKEQIRQNLISYKNSHRQPYSGIIGFDDDVIPAIDRALLSGHDIFLIGQIGQAKTRLVEIIAENLLSKIPVVKNSITNDCPMDLPSNELSALLNDTEENVIPKFYVSPETADIIRTKKLETPIEWISGKSRFKYVLATPDISVKDLVGYIDAIKVAKKGVEMYKIDSYSPGQLMQAKHGIFCIDELPVLDPRKQVALLSVLQEGRFTTGSYPVIFEPKTYFFATANPIDYTHSGKIIEPLHDRLKSHIHTHYPKTIEDEMMIILQEARIPKSFISFVILLILTKIVQKTRANLQINQEKGVSVRFGIHGLELLVGEAERSRALSKKILPVPRIVDFYCLEQVAKFELSEIDDTLENRKKIFTSILNESIKETSLDYLGNITPTFLQEIKNEFSEKTFVVSQKMIWKNGLSYGSQLEKFPHLEQLVKNQVERLRSEQSNLVNLTNKFSINPTNISITDNYSDELYAIITEIILDGLCWTNPKILDRKETGYVAA